MLFNTLIWILTSLTFVTYAEEPIIDDHIGPFIDRFCRKEVKTIEKLYTNFNYVYEIKGDRSSVPLRNIYPVALGSSNVSIVRVIKHYDLLTGNSQIKLNFLRKSKNDTVAAKSVHGVVIGFNEYKAEKTLDKKTFSCFRIPKDKKINKEVQALYKKEQSPLRRYVVMSDFKGALEAIDKGHIYNSYGDFDFTSYFMIIEKNKTDLVERIVDKLKNINVINRKNNLNVLGYIAAYSEDDLETYKKIEKKGVSDKIIDQQGNNMLMHALFSMNYKIANYLISTSFKNMKFENKSQFDYGEAIFLSRKMNDGDNSTSKETTQMFDHLVRKGYKPSQNVPKGQLDILTYCLYSSLPSCIFSFKKLGLQPNLKYFYRLPIKSQNLVREHFPKLVSGMKIKLNPKKINPFEISFDTLNDNLKKKNRESLVNYYNSWLSGEVGDSTYPKLVKLAKSIHGIKCDPNLSSCKRFCALTRLLSKDHLYYKFLNMNKKEWATCSSSSEFMDNLVKKCNVKMVQAFLTHSQISKNNLMLIKPRMSVDGFIRKLTNKNLKECEDVIRLLPETRMTVMDETFSEALWTQSKSKLFDNIVSIKSYLDSSVIMKLKPDTYIERLKIKANIYKDRRLAFWKTESELYNKNYFFFSNILNRDAALSKYHKHFKISEIGKDKMVEDSIVRSEFREYLGGDDLVRDSFGIMYGDIKLSKVYDTPPQNSEEKKSINFINLNEELYCFNSRFEFEERVIVKEFHEFDFTKYAITPSDYSKNTTCTYSYFASVSNRDSIKMPFKKFKTISGTLSFKEPMIKGDVLNLDLLDKKILFGEAEISGGKIKLYSRLIKKSTSGRVRYSVESLYELNGHLLFKLNGGIEYDARSDVKKISYQSYAHSVEKIFDINGDGRPDFLIMSGEDVAASHVYLMVSQQDGTYKKIHFVAASC